MSTCQSHVPNSESKSLIGSASRSIDITVVIESYWCCLVNIMRLSCRLLTSSLDACPFSVKTSTSSSSCLPFEQMPGPKKYSLNSWKMRRQYGVHEYFKFLERLHQEFGDVVKEEIPLGGGTVVHVFNPEDSEKVFRSDGKSPHIAPLQETAQMYRQMRGLNPGLGNLNGEEWYRLRSAVSQTMMKPQGMEKYVPFVEQVVSDLVEHIRASTDAQGEVDMKVVAGRWSLESAGLIVFERRLGALQNNTKWADSVNAMNSEFFRLSGKLETSTPFYRYFSTPTWRRLVKVEDEFYGEVHSLIDRAIDNLRGNTDLMFVGELANKPTLARRDVKAIMLSLFTDGLTTTAPMLVYNLYNLATHPEVQERIREEVNKVTSSTLTSGARNQLPVLKAAIKETFRLFPIGTEFSRIPQKPLVLGGYQIPAGIPIDINTNILTRSRRMFPEPDKFNPDRWMRENKEANSIHPYAFLPFGIGPRMCAGRRFAEQDLQITLSRLIQNFNISYNHEGVSQIYETLLLPAGDCRFQFEPIQK